MECNICAEKITSQKRKNINCEYCDFSACKECWEKWLISESTPHCMKTECTRVWTNKFLSLNFTNKFITKDFKKHKEDVLFDKERALLPATQPIVENIIESEHIQDEINNLHRVVNETWHKIRTLRDKQNDLLNKNSNRPKAKFIKACPSDNCRGFLSSQWKCGICENFFCPDCHVNKGPHRDVEHTCDPDTKATIQLLSNDTKSCPNCGFGIFKIDGCDQMWCTECHTAFNWRTGNIERSVHNPHYYEWMRRTGAQIPRNHNEIECGREIDHMIVRTVDILLNANISIKPLRLFVSENCRQIIHYRFVELPRFQTNHVENNQDLRVKYLRNQISEEEFKFILQKNNKKTEKYREIYNIYILYVNTVTDIIYRFYNVISTNNFTQQADENSRVELKTILKEISTIIKYCNECLEQVSKTYNSTLIQIPNHRRHLKDQYLNQVYNTL